MAQLETEIDLERARYQELLKDLRRNERRVKELLSQVDEEQTKVLALTDSLSKTNDKLRIYKCQIETAESSAAQGIHRRFSAARRKIFIRFSISVLTRARRLERELEDAEQRAEVVTTTLIRSRSVHRGD